MGPRFCERPQLRVQWENKAQVGLHIFSTFPSTWWKYSNAQNVENIQIEMLLKYRKIKLSNKQINYLTYINNI